MNLSLKNFDWKSSHTNVPQWNQKQDRLKLKTGYKLELLSPETMKLLGSTKKDVYKDKDGENVPKLESVEVALVHCNLVNKS